MARFLVVTADASDHGRGVRGHTLTRFLRTTAGVTSVRQITPAQLRGGSRWRADTVLVGLPSTLLESDLENLECRRLAVFDYHDYNTLSWRGTQETWLKPRTGIYLKPWYDEAWDYDLPMGMLPVRRYRRFSYSLRWAEQKAAWFAANSNKKYDVAFAGFPNRTEIYENGSCRLIEQRAEWIHAIKTRLPHLRFWGGLVSVGAPQRHRLEKHLGDISPLMCRNDKIGYRDYFRAMRSSKVLLAPGGNVPWTYRHYESLYCGAVVVTIDFRQQRMLVPFPEEGIVHVPDHGSVVPAVEQALDVWENTSGLPEHNFSQLERFWHYGTNSRRRPALLERFLAQLEEPKSEQKDYRLAS